MTDGYVGNDMGIIAEVQKHPNARVFAFGIGSSVNRFLLDKMTENGRGEVEYVSLNDDGSAAAKRFHERVRNPLLTDVSIDWGGLQVTDVYPKRLPDLFSAKPVVITGRYAGAGRANIKLRGRMSGRDFEREIPVELPENESRHDAIATLWARSSIDDLMSQDYAGIQNGIPREEIREKIIQRGLNFRLMTQFTSFVAVEEMTVTDGGEPRRIEVPVEMPEGVSHEGVFGDDKRFGKSMSGTQTMYLSTANAEIVRRSVKPPPPSKPAEIPRQKQGTVGNVSTGGGFGNGTGAGSGGGAARGVPGGVSGGVPGGTPGGVVAGAPPSSVADSLSRNSSPEEQKRQVLAKMNPSIAALIERLKVKGSPGADESKFVRNGKAEIQISLTDKSDAIMAELKQLGFEVLLDPKTSKMVLGRLPIERLAALVELKSVRYVAPMTSK